jgi:hypothetical protein
VSNIRREFFQVPPTNHRYLGLPAHNRRCNIILTPFTESDQTKFFHIEGRIYTVEVIQTFLVNEVIGSRNASTLRQKDNPESRRVLEARESSNMRKRRTQACPESTVMDEESPQI